jgi:hypothetical protein
MCTYCTHLAGFDKDDMSPWVLSSILIQRSKLSCRERGFQMKSISFNAKKGGKLTMALKMKPKTCKEKTLKPYFLPKF